MGTQDTRWPSKNCVFIDASVAVVLCGLSFTLARVVEVAEISIHILGAMSVTGLFIACRTRFYNRERLPEGVKLWALHGLLSTVAILMLITMPHNIVASICAGVFELFGISNQVELQVFVLFGVIDWIILYVACGLQLNVSVWAAVRQFTSKDVPARGYDQIGNSFCLIYAPAFILTVIVI